MVEENLFADDSRKGVGSSNMGLGELLVGSSDGGASVTAPTMWEFEKKQMSAQITLLNTQLQAETSSRIEAQVWGMNCTYYGRDKFIDYNSVVFGVKFFIHHS